jgi:LacI family transcriptional regulator
MPLYLVVRDSLREAVDAGAFPRGQRMPSTKGISQRMRVSLVTAHRALQQLVADGVLERRPGRGTYVRQSYALPAPPQPVARIALVLGDRVSLLDAHIAQIIESIRHAAAAHGAELSVRGLEDELAGAADGIILIGAAQPQLARLQQRGRPVVALDAEDDLPGVAAVRCDDEAMAGRAVEYLRIRNHRFIGFVGAEDTPGSARACWNGFFAAHQQLGQPLRQHHLLRSLSWRLDEPEQMALVRMLAAPDRPTAIFAAGFSFAISVYHAAVMAGLSIPDDLSVIGVDDTP